MKYYIKIIALFFIVVAACTKDDDETIEKNSESNLISFSIKDVSSNFTISSNNNVETILTEDIDVTNLTAVFSISAKAKMFIGSTQQNSGVSKNDFSNPLIYTVEAEDGSRTTYTVIINSESKILTFSIIELNSVTFSISELNIEATVPSGTELENLTAKFTVSEDGELYIGSTKQVSNETKNNFSNPINYDLKKDGITKKTYTVKIIIAENNKPIANAGPDKLVLISSSESEGAVNLDGSNSSDAEAPIKSFEWLLDNTVIASTEMATVNLPLGTHAITLKVIDSSNETATDEMNVEIRHQGEYKPVDVDASATTKNLYTNIASIANSNQFAFGQEFPLSFQLNSISDNVNTSDCKDVTGDHPAVYGIDPHYMLYKTTEQKQIHINEAKHAYDNGSIVTFDFHQQSKTDHKIYLNDITSGTDKSLMYDVVKDNNGSQTWFYGELDQVIDIINNDLGFPVVFRLFHEMDGDWFWWGSKATNHSTQLYVDFYRLAVNYIKERTNLVLFGWSPNQQLNESYYPGDAYVDVVGIDMYEPSSSSLKDNLIQLSNFAYNHGKVAALTETGKNNYINLSPKFWTSNILTAIEQGGTDIRIAWVLAWFNAPWKSSQNDLFIPNSNSSSTVKNDFIEFYNNSNTLFQQEVKALNVYK